MGSPALDSTHAICFESAARSDRGCLVGAWEFVADQLRSPSGAFGRHVMPMFFKRSNAAYEPDHVRGLLEDAGFGDVRMVPGIGRRGDYRCAIATKAA